MNYSFKLITTMTEEKAVCSSSERIESNHVNENICLVTNLGALNVNLDVYSCALVSSSENNLCVTKNEKIFKLSDRNFLLLKGGEVKFSSSYQGEKPAHILILLTKEFEQQVAELLNHKIKNLFSENIRIDDVLDEKIYSNLKVQESFEVIRLLKDSLDISTQLHELLVNIFDELIKDMAEQLKVIKEIGFKRSNTGFEIYKRIDIAKEYIHSYYTERVGLIEIAKVCFLSPFHLIRTFKRVLKTTPHQYLIDTRLDAARMLIANSDSPINEIANKVGFEDNCSFSKLFKRKYGIPPSQLRKQAKRA